MPQTVDGPAMPLFHPVPLETGDTIASLSEGRVSEEMRSNFSAAPQGSCVCRGIPFQVDRIAVVADAPVTVSLPCLSARWLVFLHVTDTVPLQPNEHGLLSPMKGEGRLMELACTYRLRFANGAERAVPIRRRQQVGAFTRRWGENCFEAVSHHKPRPVRPPHEQLRPGWGPSQVRVDSGDSPANLNL